MSDDKSIDVLGVKPAAEAFKHVSERAVDGIANFLGKICMPAAEEFGLLLQDKVKRWRVGNVAAVLQKAQERIEPRLVRETVAVHPRLLAAIIENGSWTDDGVLHDMWAGLLATSCTPTGRDESNLSMIHLLSRMTAGQARLLNQACEVTPMTVGEAGLVTAQFNEDDLDSPGPWHVSTEDLLTVSGARDIHALDMELDCLRELGLIFEGFSTSQLDTQTANMAVTALGFNLYVRCQGFSSVVDYLQSKPNPATPSSS